MYTFVRNIIIVEYTILSNDKFNVLFLYDIKKHSLCKINSLTKRKRQTYIDGECIGKFITSFQEKEKKFHVYFKFVEEKKEKPAQSIFLPATKVNFNLNLYNLNLSVETKILYKRLFL